VGVLAGALLVAAACGSSSDNKSASSAGTSPPATSIATTAATAAPTKAPTTVGAIDYKRFEKYIPPDKDLPEHVVYQADFDLSNEAASETAAELKQFQDTGRLGGIQFTFSVQAGLRTVSVGISYYNNSDEPKKLLRQSGDPANTSAPGRFTVPDLGDEYYAANLQLGSGESTAKVVNIAWVRGPFFISLADLGGADDIPTDIAIKVAALIDARLKADPKP
jgi:hypothetical protein